VTGDFFGITTKDAVLEVLGKRSSVHELERCLQAACNLGDFELRSEVTERLLDAVLELPVGSIHRLPKLKFATKQIVLAIFAQADDLTEVKERAQQAGQILAGKTTKNSPEDFVALSSATRAELDEFVELLSHPHSKSRLDAGRMLRKTFDRPDLAILLYELVLRNAPNFVRALTMKGAAQSDFGDLHGAVVTLERAQILQPKSKYVNTALSRAYENVGRFTEAFEVIEAVLDLWPEDVGALKKKIALLIKTNRRAELSELFDRMEYLLPPTPFRDTWVSLIAIEAMFQLGESEEARAALLRLPTPQGRDNKALYRKLKQISSKIGTSHI
jgi:tetratricopeptide (TPR) repeat protein